jgi:hypothetical protein
METIGQLFSILWAPRKTLYHVARDPRVLAPLILLTLFAGMETLLVFSSLDPGQLKVEELDRQGVGARISESDKVIHAEAARQGRSLAEVSRLFGPVFTVAIVSGLFFVVLGAGRGVPFKPFLAVTAYAFIPGIFHSIATVIVSMTADKSPQTLLTAGSISPVRFLNPATVQNYN